MGKTKRMVKFFPGTKGTFVVGDKPRRNDTCPCGGGKKYKLCHWTAHQNQIINFTPKTTK